MSSIAIISNCASVVSILKYVEILNHSSQYHYTVHRKTIFGRKKISEFGESPKFSSAVFTDTVKAYALTVAYLSPIA